MSEPTLFPLPQFPKVRRRISWEDLLGKKADDMPSDIRRARWERWKSISPPEAAEFWSTHECSDCLHIDGDWCKLQELPAAVNPILTFRHSVPGMACMGAGYEKRKTGEGE